VSAPLSPRPVRRYRPGFLPAYVANGMLGLRIGRIPLLDGLAIINGFAGIDGETGVESFARAPYPLAGDLQIGRAKLSEAPERGRLHEQRYDFACGELTTRFSFAAEAARADVDVLTFCSRTQPTLAVQRVDLRVDRACDIILSARVDPTGVPGRLLARHTAGHGPNDSDTHGALHWESAGGVGSCGLAYWTELRGAEAECTHDQNRSNPLTTNYRFRARAGRTYRLHQLACLVGDELHDEPDRQAVRLLFAGRLRGFERLREENRQAWDEIWRGRPMLIGAPTRWQAMADAAHFYLHTSVHTSSPCSTSMFGLSYWPTYHYYRGHVMWDIETFVVPPLVLTQPDVARTVLQYRSDRLTAAQRNAAMNGYRGAQFPWESSPRKGEEAAPNEGAAAAHEHHVSLDVGLAFAQYLHATHDWEWGRSHAWPVLEAICEWVVSRVTETRRGLEIWDVCGIAERLPPMNNNAYVNLAAIRLLREAMELSGPLGHKPRANWERTAERLFVPLDRRTKVIRNHDAYRVNEEKGETPEGAAALFPLGYQCPSEVERATFEFALTLADKYVGAPMLSSVLGVFAARIGDRRRALELFERGYAAFVTEPYSVTLEYEPTVFPEQPQAAPFTANLSGLLMSCLYGLTGLRLSSKPPDEWCERPIVLPDGWDAIEVERISARGAPAHLVARHGEERATLAYT
jgi:protein-glucosylgalactosylhydroxylysine glucosidase